MTTLQEFDRLYQRAKNKRSAVNSVLEECWKYVLPMYERQSPHNATADKAPEINDIYDATASSAAQDLASEVLDDIWPASEEPFRLQLGPDVRVSPDMRKRIDGDLSARAEALTAAINGSGLAEGQSWYSAAHEALLDWTISQGFIAAHRGEHGLADVWFEHMPLPTVLPLRMNGQTCVLFRDSKMTRREIMLRWPAAKLRPGFSVDSASLDVEIDVTEGIIRDWSVAGVEAWETVVRVKGMGDGGFVHQARETGPGSKPFIDFAFMVANGDTLGRGPALIALPHIRVVNAVVQMHLDNLDMALNGIWGYETGGLNTEMIEIKPGLVVPYEPGTKGLLRLDGARNEQGFRDAVLMIQAAIRDVMYGFDLGPTDQTPRSATEVVTRRSVSAKRKSGPNHRLLSGLITQTVQFVDWALVKAGKLAPIDLAGIPGIIDGRTVLVRPVSPLTRSQNLGKVVRSDQYVELLVKWFGPAAAPATLDLATAAPLLAEWIGVDPRINRPVNDLRKLEQLLLTAAAQQGAPSAGGAAAPGMAA